MQVTNTSSSRTRANQFQKASLSMILFLVHSRSFSRAVLCNCATRKNTTFSSISAKFTRLLQLLHESGSHTSSRAALTIEEKTLLALCARNNEMLDARAWLITIRNHVTSICWYRDGLEHRIANISRATTSCKTGITQYRDKIYYMLMFYRPETMKERQRTAESRTGKRHGVIKEKEASLLFGLELQTK